MEQNTPSGVLKAEVNTTGSSIVNKIDRHKPNQHRRSRQGGQNGQRCHRCGGKHDPSQCSFREYECNYCKKTGHLAKVCRKKAASTNNQEQANVVIGETQTEYAMFHISCGSSKPLQTTITVNRNPLTMEVDTGASVSIINRTTFDRIRNGQSTLDVKSTNVLLVKRHIACPNRTDLCENYGP